MYIWGQAKIMKHFFKVTIFLILVLIFMSCSRDKREYEIKGRLIFDNKPVHDVEVSIYVKEEKDKTTPPIKVIASDENGNFKVKLTKGTYYINARKRHESAGDVLMLVGEPKKVELTHDVNMGDWVLYSKKDKRHYEKGTGIRGKVKNFNDYSKVRVYVYENTKTDLRGPDYLVEGKVKSDGSFVIDLKEGKYYVAARERKKDKAGPLSDEDLSTIYEKNPIEILKDRYVDLGNIILKKVDIEKWSGVINKGIITDGLILTGIVVKRDGKPANKIYVLAYDSQEMVGRPISISPPTKEDGTFSIVLPRKGKYYIGARSKLGGPVEPGEYVGTYTGNYDKSVFVDGTEQKKIKIEVNEVW